MKNGWLLPVVVTACLAPGLLQAQCLPGWGFSMPVTVTNPNAAPLSSFEVRLVIDTATPIGAGQMLASGNDIRFATDACADIPYWIESGINTAATAIWVKIPSVPAGGSTTFDMVFGNPLAPAASSGTSVFRFFDDFDDGSFDAGRWTTRGTPSTLTETGGILTLAGNANWEYVRSNTSWTGPVVIESREFSQGVSAAMVLGYAGTDDRYSFRDTDSGTKGTTEDNDVAGGNIWLNQAYPAVPHPGAGYNEFQLSVDLVAGAIQLSRFCNVTTASCNTTVTPLNTYTGSAYYVGFTSYDSRYVQNVDWVRARSFATQAPTSSNGATQPRDGAAAPIPTASEWGLLLMTGLIGLFAVLALRRNATGLRAG